MPDIKTIADKVSEMYLRWLRYSKKGYYEK